VVTSNSSSISSEVALDQVHDLLRHTRFAPTTNEIKAVLLRNGNNALLAMTELLPSSTGLSTVASPSSTNGVVTTSHSSANNSELRMDIDSPSADGSKAPSLETFLSKMEHPDNNIFKHYLVDGGELPEELYQFTGNNVFGDYSFVNESKLEQRAVDEFKDKTRYVRPQTLTAAKVLLCLAMHNSFPVLGTEEVGPLRAGNQFLEGRGIQVMSTGPTQSMQFRMFTIALREFWNVPSKTALVMTVQASLWLESCYNSFHKKAGSKGQEDHDALVRMLKESADETAECNRDLIVSNKIMDVIVYGGIAQGFVSDNDVIPSGARVYQAPHSCSLVQGTTFRGNCEALIAPITAIKRLIGDNSLIDINKVMEVVGMELTSFTYENNMLRSSGNFILTAAYSMGGDNDEQVDIIREKGTESMKRLLRRKRITFANPTFPTQDKFFDSNGKLVSVQWNGLTMSMEYWYNHTYFNNEFGTESGGFGAREGSLLQHYIQNHTKAGKHERTAVILSITKTDEGDITNEEECMIVCGAALEDLKPDAANAHYGINYAGEFKKQRLTRVFKGLMFGGGDINITYNVPLEVFGEQAMIKSKTFDSVEEMQKVLPVNDEAYARAVECTDIVSWKPKLFLHKPPIGNNKPTCIGSISTLAEMKPLLTAKKENPNYPWHGVQEARPACNYNGSDGAAINRQLGSLRLEAAGRSTKWVDGEAALSAIRNRDQIAIECPTVPSSTSSKVDGYALNENKETFIFAAVRLDEEDSSDDEVDSSDSDDDVDEDQYY